MRQSLWVLNRLGATIVGCIAVGALAAVIMAAYAAWTCGPTCVHIVGNATSSHCASYASNCGYFLSDVLGGLFWTIPGALVLGLLPGAAAVTLTPARNHPWHSLPLLIAGTLVGFALFVVIADRLKMQYGVTQNTLLVALPTATGMAAAFLVKRTAPPQTT